MTEARPSAHCARLFEGLEAALLCADPVNKCALVAELGAWLNSVELDWREIPQARGISEPGRPLLPKLVAPRELAQRGLGSALGRAALVHAVAHIEFNAINLALDAAHRFRKMPDAYYRDWLSVAVDEARHFQLLATRLGDMGYAYGDFDAHNGLWEMCLKTQDDVLLRMALVPRVLEARGLDVTPGMIERLRVNRDLASVAALEIILSEEVRHVEIGTRWFHVLCRERGLDPDAHFLSLIHSYAHARVKPPFNLPARYSAGFSEHEMKALSAL